MNRTLSQRRTFPDSARQGLTLLELLFLLGIASFLFILMMPGLVRLRETSRQKTCQFRIAALTRGLHAYMDVHHLLPPAAIWDSSATMSTALHHSKRIERVTQGNWSLLLLPHVTTLDVSDRGDPGKAIGDPANASIRQRRLSQWICPSDDFNRASNPFRVDIPGHDEPVLFARGNYAINGGSHHYSPDPPTTTSPRGDHMHLIMSESPRQFSMWGNGIAGINKSFQVDNFRNGQSTLVAIEEIRAGIHLLDPRGVWSLGQIGGSITWAHGINGDAVGPNQSWVRADDIMNCSKLHSDPGTETLIAQNMPCVNYVDVNQQATSRSRHPGGVHAGMLDGSVRFLSDHIDPGVWHLLHSRETPPDRLSELTKTSNRRVPSPIDVELAPEVDSKEERPFPDMPIENSIGMRLIPIRPGQFLMGQPDPGRHGEQLEEVPPHPVTLTRGFYMGAHEVTRQQFVTVMGEEALPDIPVSLLDRPIEEIPSDELDQLPVTGVTWDQAHEFCQRLTDRPEEQQAGRRYRLPSEAEWEFACRAGEPPRILPDSELQTHGEAAGRHPPLPLRPVGSYLPNAWGLFDMRGNAWEWTNDWYQRDYYVHSPAKNPTGPPRGEFKVVRGGNWRFVGEDCLIDSNPLPPWKGNPVVGFRVVFVPD